jgi:hypothetical protein
MIFQNSMGLGKSKCDVPSGTTQEWACCFLEHHWLVSFMHVNNHYIDYIPITYHDVMIFWGEFSYFLMDFFLKKVLEIWVKNCHVFDITKLKFKTFNVA